MHRHFLKPCNDLFMKYEGVLFITDIIFIICFLKMTWFPCAKSYAFEVGSTGIFLHVDMVFYIII